MNGDTPEAADTRELWAYSTIGNHKLHSSGRLAVTHLSVFSRVWLVRSAWPLVCGWYSDERLAVDGRTEGKPDWM